MKISDRAIYFLSFFMMFVLPLTGLMVLFVGPEYCWLAPFISFVFQPLNEIWFEKNQSKDFMDRINAVVPESSRGFNFILYALSFFVLFLIGFGIWKSAALPAGWGGIGSALGYGLAVGFVSGAVGFITAHELIHRRTSAERGLGLGLLFAFNYPTFQIEHFGHHRDVGKPWDPDTARKGESVYAFYIRSFFNGVRLSWDMEKARTQRKYQGQKYQDQIRAFLANRVVIYSAFQVVLNLGIYLALGPVALAFFAAQSLVSILLLETTNYVEHYGLERQKKDGKWLPVTAELSWDTDKLISNFSLLNLGRHSSHHMHPTKTFERLEHHKGAKQVPLGYPTMIVTALFPPIWFRLMK